MFKITALVENISQRQDLEHEHGLSYYVETEHHTYLVDTGGSSKFIKNAETLGIDLMAIDYVIISHNHSDHIGGLKLLLELNPKVKVLIKKAAQSQFYAKVLFKKVYIGEEKGVFEVFKDRIQWIESEYDLGDGNFILSDLVREEAYVCKDKRLLEKKGKTYVADAFDHELFLVFNLKDGLVLLSSCSHSGIVNLVNTVKKKFPDKEIGYIIGGFHMKGLGLKKLNCSKEFVAKTADYLNRMCTQTIYTCHCTGLPAYELMKNQLNDKIQYFSTGETLSLD